MLFQNGTITMRYIHMNDHMFTNLNTHGGWCWWAAGRCWRIVKINYESSSQIWSTKGNMGIEYNNNIRIHLVRDPGFTSRPYSSTRGRPSRSLSFVQHILVMKQDLHSLFCLNIEVTLSLPGRRLESQRRPFAHLPSSRLPAPGKNSILIMTSKVVFL